MKYKNENALQRHRNVIEVELGAIKIENCVDKWDGNVMREWKDFCVVVRDDGWLRLVWDQFSNFVVWCSCVKFSRNKVMVEWSQANHQIHQILDFQPDQIDCFPASWYKLLGTKCQNLNWNHLHQSRIIVRLELSSQWNRIPFGAWTISSLPESPRMSTNELKLLKQLRTLNLLSKFTTKATAEEKR